MKRKTMTTMRLACALGLSSALTVAQDADAGRHVRVPTRVSVSSAGEQGNDASYFGHLSKSARFVAFSSDADDLVSNDTNEKTDVFWHDRYTGQTRRVSLSTNGTEGDGRSFAGGVTKNGRVVVFWSHATNLVAGDTNGVEDVFLHDVRNGETTRINLGARGVQADGVSRSPSMSDDGRWIAYHSGASNLVPGDTNGETDIFLYAAETGLTTRVGQPADAQSDGSSLAPKVSANGRFLAFESMATNLVPSDTNGTMDAFVFDQRSGTLTRVSVSSAGEEGDSQSRTPRIAPKGRFVVYHSLATNLVAGDSNDDFDSFMHDMKTGETTRVSVSSQGVEGNGDSFASALSRNGRFVLLTSRAANLVEGDTNESADVFVHDRRHGTTTRITRGLDGQEPNADVFAKAMSANGRYVLVGTEASNLVGDDTNGEDDLFLLRSR